MPRGDELANRVSAGPYAATAAGHGTPPHDRSPVGDELANRVSVRPHAAKAARQGTPPQDSCALDDGPTESRRHQSPDVGEVPRTSHPVKVSSVLVLVPVQDPTTHGSTGNRSACELTAEEANESSDAATSPRGNGCRAGSSSSRGLATPSTPASESGSPCGSMSGAADDTDSRRKRKRPAFKSPLPLMEGALSILSRLSGTPISRACGEGRSVGTKAAALA